jgi:methylenetetrahydrofolate dehydrogenase (NADP+)/methenyltetrahydrofolate cyclohydrolase
MSATILDGNALAAETRAGIAEQVAARVRGGLRRPGLAVVLVGDDPASRIYVRHKRRDCEQVGIRSFNHDLPASTTQRELLAAIDALNADDAVDGILVQLPLPAHLDARAVVERIRPDKDVDGFHPFNMGRLAQRNPLLRPCTPFGILKLLERGGETFKRRHAVVIGASNIVGRPMALELLLAGATVTVCHRFTADSAVHAREADLVVVAVGRPDLVQPDWIRPGATVVDVGMNRLPDGRLVGDCAAGVAEVAGQITPVPGGVGPMTRAMLLHNTMVAVGLRE